MFLCPLRTTVPCINYVKQSTQPALNTRMQHEWPGTKRTWSCLLQSFASNPLSRISWPRATYHRNKCRHKCQCAEPFHRGQKRGDESGRTRCVLVFAQTRQCSEDTLPSTRAVTFDKQRGVDTVLLFQKSF